VDGARAVMIRETSDVVDRIDVGPRELIKVSA
jgi:hypothetical protein